MPRLVMFCPCDNVLIGTDNSASLIQIMNKFQVAGEIPDPLPLNAAMQVRWFIFAQWEISQDEFGLEFEQRTRIVQGEQSFFEIVGEFTTEAGKTMHRMIANLNVFPLIPAGQYRLRVDIRRKGNDLWQKGGDYPLDVAYQHIHVPA